MSSRFHGPERQGERLCCLGDIQLTQEPEGEDGSVSCGKRIEGGVECDGLEEVDARVGALHGTRIDPADSAQRLRSPHRSPDDVSPEPRTKRRRVAQGAKTEPRGEEGVLDRVGPVV